MIKIDRIGNKLGLVGAVGVLFSAGMAANQLISELAVIAANERVNRQEIIANHSLEGNLGLLNMQLAVRDIWQSKNQPEAESGFNNLNSNYATAVKELGIAGSRAQNP